MTPELRGVYPVLSTPFTSDGAIDAASLRRQVSWLLEHDVDGVAIAMVSEVLRLDTYERYRLTDLVRDCLPDDIGLVVSVGAESTVVAARLARHAAEHGATALIAIPPTAVALDDDALFGYYATLADSTSRPVVIQDASGYVGRPMSLALLERLFAAYGEDRVLFKPESEPIGPRLSALRDATGGRARVFEGSGGLGLVDSYRRGIVGTMPGPEVPWAIVPLWRCLQSGDEAGAYTISAALAPLLALQTSLDSYVAIEKHLLVESGVFAAATAREPVAYQLDDETRAEVDRLVVRLRAAVDGLSSPASFRQSR